MHHLSKLALGIAASTLAAHSFGCSDPNIGSTGTGGSTPTQTGGGIGSGGQSGTGGTSGSAGSGGASDTGGRLGAGGASTTTGTAGIGGSNRPDGSPGVGGEYAIGGRTEIGTGGGMGMGGAQGVDGGASAGGSTGTPGTLKKYFGNIDTSGQIRSDFKSMWDQFSPENAGKWGSVQGGGQSSFNWSSLDAMYKYTQDNGIIFKEHCFCWGAQQPSWVNNSNGPAAVQAWMKAFCDRYPKVAMIDVFNESLHNSPAYKDGIGGTGTSGYDWLVNAFKWARAACPNAILLYNDYNTIEYASENSGVIKLINAVKAAGGPVDGVGCQGHDVGKVSASTVTTYVNNITSQTGLPVYITEMDVGEADDNTQMTKIKDVVTPLWANDKVAGFTYWGYIVGRTWRDNTGLMTDSGTKRPALTWLMSFLGR